MLKPSLQLKLGQQLTMTPQLQQAIRLLQLPALELQAHIRELLETNVMLEPLEEAEATGTFETVGDGRRAAQGPRAHRGKHGRGARRGLGRAQRRARRDALERRRRRAPAGLRRRQPGSRCRITCCGSWSWRASSRASWRSRAPSSMRSATTAISPSRSRRSRRRCARRSNARRRRWQTCSRGVQALDPPGVAARSVGECIELQLRQLDPATPGFATGARDRPPPPRAGRRARAVAAAPRAARHRGGDRRGAGAGALLPSAPGRHRQRRQRGVRGAGRVRAPHRARLGRGDQPRDAAARAPQSELRQPHRPQRQPRHHARAAAGGALAAEEPRDPPRDADEGGALDRRAPDGVPRARRRAHAADDPQGHRRGGRRCTSRPSRA